MCLSLGLTQSTQNMGGNGCLLASLAPVTAGRPVSRSGVLNGASIVHRPLDLGFKIGSRQGAEYLKAP